MNEREDDKKAVRAELSDFMEEIRRDGKAGLAAFYERYKNMILRTALVRLSFSGRGGGRSG